MHTIGQRELDVCASQKSEEWEVLSVRSTYSRCSCGIKLTNFVTILQSIYPDCVSRSSSNGVLKFEIPVELEYPRDVFVTGSETTETQEHHLTLSSLPPVLMEVVLPPTYPLFEAPKITSFHVSGSWIPRSGLLLEALMEMWRPGEGILYTWVEWIRSAAFLSAMHIIHDDVLRWVMRWHADGSF